MMKRALLTVVPVVALIGGVAAAADEPADPVVSTAEALPPVVPVEPTPADWTPTYSDQALNDWQTDGYAVYGPETFPTTPQHDQCWSNADVNVLLESGQFVIYGNDDPRRWGTHSIGGMNCGPADLPMPEPAPAPLAATAAVPTYDPNGAACD